MGTIISFGNRKGGVGKSTTVGIVSFLIAKKHKVLAVDFDGQGNLTQMLTQKSPYDYRGKTAYEACLNKNPLPYIVKLSSKLHLLPAEDLLDNLPRYLYREYNGIPENLLRETLNIIRDDYGYILIDLPPNTGDCTLNGLSASDYAVVLLQSEPFCLDALDRYIFSTLKLVQKNRNQSLRLLGILTTMIDRTSLSSIILEKARKDWEEYVFDTVIKRKSKIKEFSITGISDRTKADRQALKEYQNFTKELISRVQKR